MKKIFYLFLLIFLAESCKNKLDLKPFDKLSPSTAFNRESDLQLYVNSFYKMLPTGNTIIRGDAMSDYVAPKSVSIYLTPGGYSSQQAGGWKWDNLRNVNYFLEHAGEAQVPDDIRDHYMGIARFFRAWFYFDMVKQFGNVPWYSKTMDVSDPDLYKPRDPRSQVMDSVLADLNFACTHIRSQKDNTCSEITRWVALAFKSRVCLFEGTFRKYHDQDTSSMSGGMGHTAATWLTEAAAAADEVIEGGQYTIHTNANIPGMSYRELFTSQQPPSDEVMLAYICNKDLTIYNDANWYYTSATYGSRLSFTKAFIDTYLNGDGSRFTDQNGYDAISFSDEVKNRDLRLQQTIRMGDYKRSDGTPAPPDFTYTYTGYEPYKFTLDSKATDGVAQNDNSIPIIRYAEVLLNDAEAKEELGTFNVTDWDKTIKVLRDRAGIANTGMPVVADPYLEKYFKNALDDDQTNISDPVLLEIRRERGIELALEGFRFDDLDRWKKGRLLERPYNGLYVPAMNTLYDLNEDSKPDVSFVDQIPDTKQPGVTYVLIDHEQMRLSDGNTGTIIWLENIEKKWEDYKYFYPIPYNELVLNPKLGQNPGWE